MIVRKRPAELEKMRQSGLLVWKVLQKLGEMASRGREHAGSGSGGGKDDRRCRGQARFQGIFRAGGRGAVPIRAVHFDQRRDRARHAVGQAGFEAGDIVSIDTGVELDGYYGDSALTVAVGEVNAGGAEVDAGDRGVAGAGDSAGAGGKPLVRCLRDGGAARGLERLFDRAGICGHGIGTKLHEEPQIPNYVDRKNENPRLKEGMVLAIEPMVNAGGPESKVLRRQVDRGNQGRTYSAHFEHCVAVTENGPWVLTRP